MSVQPDADELELRARLRALVDHGATRPAGEGDDLEHAAPATESPLQGLQAWADQEAAPAVPAPRQGSPRVTDWWAQDRPHLAVVKEPEDQAEEPDAPAAEDQEQPEPEPGEETTSSSRPGLRARVRSWVEAVEERTGHRQEPGDTPDDAGDTGDTGDDEAGDAEENAGDTAEGGPKEGGPVSKTTGALRWPSRPRKAPRPRHRPRFAAAGIPHTMKPAKERKSLLEIIRCTPDHVRWMVYNGSALGAGFYLGWPQWVKEGTAFLAAEHPTLTDTYSLTCYALAGGVVFLDYRSHRWVLPAAWLFRIPTVSLAVGVPLHGVSTPISQLF